ncbi:MAG: TlpA disulfide reductase family protein [Rhodoferax sp.]|jgi:thiol-disulfide isomerase/thioredoxin|nr:TlpA family protein disulfide reductase [Rhodoferax sp.]
MQDIPMAPPEWQVSEWLNTATPPTLAGLRGQVVVVHAFQMLCPGCVAHGLPQARRIAQVFAGRDVAVLGLHTVFEHHAVMTPAALRVFLQEYRITFPVGIDRPGDPGPLPCTMQAYGLEGTPTLLVFDRSGQLCLRQLGQLDDMAVGGLIGELLALPA